MAIKIIEKYITKPRNNNLEVSEITEKTDFLYLRKHESLLTKEKIIFLKELYEKSSPDFRINKTSAIYFFDTGNGYIELDIYINKKKVYINPYIHYNKDTIKNDLIEINKVDYTLYALLKINDLQ